MPLLVQTPGRVWLLKVGDSYYYEAAVGDDVGILQTLLSQNHAEQYRGFVEPFRESAMSVVEISLRDLWADLRKLNQECLKSFGCPLKLLLSHVTERETLHTLEVLWDPTATIH